MNDGSAGEISELLGTVAERLQILKRKAEESLTEELSAGYVCKRRLEHLKHNVVSTEGSSIELQTAAANQWKKVGISSKLADGITINDTLLQIRLDRMMVEHFLRLGFYETAEILATRSGIRDLTNMGM